MDSSLNEEIDECGIILNQAKAEPFSVVANSCHSRVIRNQQNLYPKFLLLS